MKPLDYRTHNRNAWNRMAQSGNRFASPAKEKDFLAPLASVDGPGWLGESIAGKQVLCLAAGGGRQGPVYAAAGAHVTVVDISNEMLELDRQIGRQHDLNLRLVETSMEDLSMFDDQTFDIVIQPVSTCYIPDVRVVYNEIARVTRTKGIYISQHKQPSSLQSSIQPTRQGYLWLHNQCGDNTLPVETNPNLVREAGTVEFLHSWDLLLGEMCRSGFVIQDLMEPDHASQAAKPGEFEHRSQFIPPYVRILAMRNSAPARRHHKIWTNQ